MEPGISKEIVSGVAQALGALGFVAPAVGSSDYVAGSTADAMLDAAAAQLKDEALGIHLAQQLPIGALGPLDYALITSASVRMAMTRVARYYGVVTQRVRLTIEEDGEHARLVFTRKHGLALSRHWLEFSFAVIANRLMTTVGGLAFLDVAHAHPPPKKAKAHDAYFGVKVRFDAPVDVLVLPVKLMGAPLSTAAESLAEVLEARLRELQPASGEVDPLLGRVRRAMVELLDKRMTGLAHAAAALKRSARTLQRELQQRGTSHQQLLDEIRKERALTLLAEEGSQLTEVSWKLGYSEPSAFFRAYRRWTGTTPRAGA